MNAIFLNLANQQHAAAVLEKLRFLRTYDVRRTSIADVLFVNAKSIATTITMITTKTTTTKLRTIPTVLFLLLLHTMGVVTAFQLNPDHSNARQQRRLAPFQTNRSDFLQRSIALVLISSSGTATSPPPSLAVEESSLFLPKDARVQIQKAQKVAKKEIKKVKKEVKKEVKKVETKATKEIKFIQKEVTKESKKMKKEVKVVQKDITKEMKKLDTVVSKKTQALQSSVGQAVNTNAIRPLLPATTSPSSSSGVDVSRLKVCDGVNVKCVR